MNHISTTSVSASLPENSAPVTFDEHCLYVGQNYSDNIYIKTKFEAEYNIFNAIENNHLKASVYRLGNITARYLDGKFQENFTKNAFFNRVLTLSKLNKFPKSLSNIEIDLSPVDICAKIICSLIQLECTYPKVFHIYNNKSIKLFDLTNLLNGKNNISIVSDAEFYRYIRNKSDILGLINDLTSNYKKYNSNITINNNFTLNYMNNLALEWPKIDELYINKFFKKFFNKGDS